jgi:hypothetical protein
MANLHIGYKLAIMEKKRAPLLFYFQLTFDSDYQLEKNEKQK